MPSSQQILDRLAAVATDWRALVIAWHFELAVILAGLSQMVPGGNVSQVLCLPFRWYRSVFWRGCPGIPSMGRASPSLPRPSAPVALPCTRSVEPVLCLSLQRTGYSGGGGSALPVLRLAAKPGPCRCRDEPEFHLVHRQCSAFCQNANFESLRSTEPFLFLSRPPFRPVNFCILLF